MDAKDILAGVGLIAVGFVVGAGSPVGDRVGAEPSPAATVTETVTAAPVESATPRGLSASCQSAMAAAEDAVGFVPEALSRLRAAYEQAEQSEGGGQSGPPPEAVFSRLQSEAQAVQSRFSGAEQACAAETR